MKLSLIKKKSLIKDWCAKWRVKINAGKSEAILFGQKRTKLEALEPPHFGDRKIE